MKFAKLFSILIVICIVLLCSCNTSPVNPINPKKLGGGVINPDPETVFSGVRLMAGQYTDIGYVKAEIVNVVENEINIKYLRVTYDCTESGWTISEIHFHVAENEDGLPTNRSGNPQVGKFLYSNSSVGNVTSYTFDIKMTELYYNIWCGQEVFFAAHCIARGDVDGDMRTETAWGKAVDWVPFTDKNGSWAMYFIVPVFPCN